MGNPNKARGTRWETQVAQSLQEVYPEVERRALSGTLDKGDIINLPDWVIECKAEKSIRLSAYMKEAEAEAKNADATHFAAVVKKRNANTEDAFVVLPLYKFKELLEELKQ